jgi:hypothetical protein
LGIKTVEAYLRSGNGIPDGSMIGRQVKYLVVESCGSSQLVDLVTHYPLTPSLSTLRCLQFKLDIRVSAITAGR